MTIVTEPHPRWGRPLDQYSLSYGHDSAKHRAILDSDTVIEAHKAINKICRLGGSGDQVHQNNEASQIMLPTLESVLKLALSPSTFRDLSCPPLISGCINLMAMVEHSGKPSPFSYEYGFLCFRIITIALGVCLLERSDNLEMTIDNMITDPETEILLVLSGHVSRVIQDEIESTQAEGYCDWLLGWNKSPDHPRQDLLVLRGDLSTLLRVLWEDRKLFLTTLMSTYSPGLSQVMFVLWRYMYAERFFEEQPSPKRLVTPFCEVLWRYMLVATSDQTLPLVYMNNEVSERSTIWDDSPKFVDLEDSRAILHAYIGRLSPVDLRLYEPLSATAMPVLLRFLTALVQPGSEDLLPSLFGLTLGRFWDILLGHEEEDDVIVESMGATFMFFGNLFKPLHHTFYSNRYAMVQILEAIIENDILGLIGRTLLLMRPTSDESSPEFDKNIDFLTNAETMFSALAKVVPRRLLEYDFRNYVLDWLKYMRHLTTLAYCMTNTPRPDVGHFRACRDLWYTIAKSLGLQDDIKWEQARFIGCAYARCPNPDVLEGAQLACDKCSDRPYCSPRCQALDWTLGSQAGPHRKLCREGV